MSSTRLRSPDWAGTGLRLMRSFRVGVTPQAWGLRRRSATPRHTSNERCATVAARCSTRTGIWRSMQEQSAEEPGRRPAGRTERSWRISGMESCRAPRTRRRGRPPQALEHLFTRYEIWSPAARRRRDGCGAGLWVLPGEARLVVVEAGGHLSALIGNRRYDSLPQVVLFGPSSRATRLAASGGSVVAIGLSALGWAGIVGRSAAALGDRVVAAADVFDGGWWRRSPARLERRCEEGLANRLDAVLGATPPCALPGRAVGAGADRRSSRAAASASRKRRASSWAWRAMSSGAARCGISAIRPRCCSTGDGSCGRWSG